MAGFQALSGRAPGIAKDEAAMGAGLIGDILGLAPQPGHGRLDAAHEAEPVTAVVIGINGKFSPEGSRAKISRPPPGSAGRMPKMPA